MNGGDTIFRAGTPRNFLLFLAIVHNTHRGIVGDG